MSEGSITLGQAAEHTAVLTVACTRCERAGRYNLDTLIARHGEGFSIPKLLRLLSKDCVKRASVSAYDLCGVHCPELPGSSLRGGLTSPPCPCPARPGGFLGLARPAVHRPVQHAMMSRRAWVHSR